MENNVFIINKRNDYSFSGLFHDHVELNNYKNDFDVLSEHGGVIQEAGHTSLSNIDCFGENQTRAKDFDKGHVKILANQIKADGLSKIIFVEWNREEERFTILSGHHRVHAFRTNGEDDNKIPDEIWVPICVVSFNDKDKKRMWLHKENQHEASKSHTTKDAEKLIRDLKNEGYKNWDTRDFFIKKDGKKTPDQTILKEAYDALTQHGYKSGGYGKRKIVIEAFQDGEHDTVMSYVATTADSTAQSIWNQKKDKWESSTYVIASSRDASRKCQQIAVQELARIYCERGQYNIKRNKLNMFIYYPGSYQTLEWLNTQRTKFLNQQKINNLLTFRGTNTTVHEVVFAPQFKCSKKKHTENKYIRYRWDYENEEFNLIK